MNYRATHPRPTLELEIRGSCSLSKVLTSPTTSLHETFQHTTDRRGTDQRAVRAKMLRKLENQKYVRKSETSQKFMIASSQKIAKTIWGVVIIYLLLRG